VSYTLEEIKEDLLKIDVNQFYMKHIVRTENWYFENILNIPRENIVSAVDDFKIIVSDALGVSYNSVMMVGSGKTGYSFSPTKKLKKFTLDPIGEEKSDIDIAIISDPIFNRFWELFRKEYCITNKRFYPNISRGIYRGFINASNINKIEGCRIQWQDISNKASRKLKQAMYFKHDISYRLYRSWEDFEEYNLSSLNELKMEVGKDA